MTYYQVPSRDKIKIGERVKIIQKIHYDSGEITEGVVEDILTSSTNHPRGIKVRLVSGLVGRVLALGGQEVKALNEDIKPTPDVGTPTPLTENDLV